MALLHLDAQANYIQSIPENTGGEGGYTEMVAQADTTGGFAGGVAKISGPWALLVEPGHLLQWWVSGRPVYAGVVVDPGEPSKTEREVTMLGALRNCWENTPADLTYASATQLASAVIKDLITNYTADPLISTDVSHVQTSGYTIAGNLAFSKQHQIDMATRVNNFEGWEWGGFLPNPGSALLQKTAVYYRPPDTSTLHYSVAANELKESPKFSRDWSKFGNKIRVYYGAASYADYNGTATSQSKGIKWQTIDISGDTTTLADAQQTATAFLEGLKVDGVETPPVSIECTLTSDSKLQAGHGAQRDIFSIVPGQNIMVSGLANVPRLLAPTNSQVFLHINTVRLTQTGEVTLSAGRSYDPAVLLARLKGAAA